MECDWQPWVTKISGVFFQYCGWHSGVTESLLGPAQAYCDSGKFLHKGFPVLKILWAPILPHFIGIGTVLCVVSLPVCHVLYILTRKQVLYISIAGCNQLCTSFSVKQKEKRRKSTQKRGKYTIKGVTSIYKCHHPANSLFGNLF